MENNEKEEKDNEHKFLLRIHIDIWKRFIETLPESISANEKINKLLLDYLIQYENTLGEFSNAKKNTRNKN